MVSIFRVLTVRIRKFPHSGAASQKSPGFRVDSPPLTGEFTLMFSNAFGWTKYKQMLSSKRNRRPAVESNTKNTTDLWY